MSDPRIEIHAGDITRLAVGAIVNFLVAMAVSRLTAAPPEHIQHLVEDIRVPAGAGAASAH